MHVRFLRVLVLIGAALVTPAAHAQDAGDRGRGRVAAQQYCADCHAVGSGRERSPNAAAPSFVAVAASPGMTAMALNAFFQTSHHNMPNFILPVDRRNDIAAYILSLKK